MAKAKKSGGRKKPRSKKQKAATAKLVARNRKCPPVHKAKKGRKKAVKKGGRKKARSSKQKAATARMVAANRKKGGAKKGRAKAR